MTTSEDTLFQETRVSSAITQESVTDFYLEHGIYYQEDADIGNLAVALAGKAPAKVNEFLSLALRDQRARSLIKPFLAGKYKSYYFLGRDKGKFFAHTADSNQDHRIIIYMFHRGTRLGFIHKSQDGSFEGVAASNRLLQIPYVQLRDRKEFEIRLDEGGMLIMHPRLVFTVEDTQGAAIGYVFEAPSTNPQSS